MLDKVLPDQPTILLAAALYIYPEQEDAPEPRLLLSKAMALIDSEAGPLNAEELHVKAVLHGRLGQSSAATIAYQEALAQQPLEVGWRYDFAKQLYDQGRFPESQRELRIILSQKPRHEEASRLAQVLARQVAEGDTEQIMRSRDDSRK